MRTGRPTKYNPAFCDEVIELGRQGKSPAQIAAALEVTRPTLYEWAEKHPDFSTAITRAKVLEQAWWEDQGQSALTAERFNATVWAKSMQARFRDDYTERQEVKQEHSGSVVTRVENVIVDPANTDRKDI